MRRLIVGIVAFLVCICFATPLSSTASSAKHKLVIFLIPGGMTQDIVAPGLSNFQQMFKVGACGVMTTRTAGASQSGPATEMASGQPASVTRTEAACLSIGAGARAAGSAEARHAYNASEIVQGELAANVYRRLSMKEVAPSCVVHLSIHEMKKYNSPLPYSITLGMIGETLHRNGLTTACVGNSDTNAAVHREAVAVAMDADGIVDVGDVGRRMTRRNKDAPYGIETNHQALLSALDRVLPKADLIVVDSGELVRADWYAEECSDEQAAKMRQWALGRTDALLGEVMRRIDLRDSLLMVISPCPSPKQEAAGAKMTPILIAGKGFVPGVLASASTRQPCVVTNTDVAPTVLAYFGLTAANGLAGRPLGSIPHRNSQALLIQTDNRLALQSSRLVITRFIASILAIVVVVGSVFRYRRNVARQLALIPPVVAPVMLFLPIFGSYPAVQSGIITISLAVAALAAIRLMRIRPDRALLLISTVLCAAIAVDLLRGGVWLAGSPLSYSPAEGSRFYGLGNELMGSFLGAAVITIFGLFGPRAKAGDRSRRRRNLLCLTCFGLLVLLIGATSLGANVGGALAALTASAAAVRIVAGKGMTLRRWLMAACAGLLAVAAFIALDALRGSGSQSHLGRAVDLVLHGGAGQFALIIERKVAMNVKLLQISLWSKLLLISLAALIYLRVWKRPRAGESEDAAGTASATAERYLLVDRSRSIGTGITAGPRPLPAAFAVIVVAAIAAFIFNDSGVVAAATCIVYAWSLAMIAD